MSDTSGNSTLNGALQSLHAQYHRSSVDVFAHGSRGSNPDMPPKPGMLIVDYLPSRLANPQLARKMYDLEQTMQEARERGISSDEAALRDTEGYTDTMANFLLSVVWSLKVTVPGNDGKPVTTVYSQGDNLTYELFAVEFGPVMMGEMMLALQGEQGEKKGSDANTTTTSLMTQSSKRATQRRKSS